MAGSMQTAFELVLEGYEVVITPYEFDKGPRGISLEVKGGGLTVRRLYTRKEMRDVGKDHFDVFLLNTLKEMLGAIGEHLEKEVRRGT